MRIGRVVALLSLLWVLAGPVSFAAAADGENPIFPFAPDLAIWTLIVFLGLFFIIRKFAWLPYLQGLHKREETIRLAAEEAKLARVEAEQMRVELDARLKETFAQIPRMMEEARQKAEAERQTIVNSALAEIQTERQRLRQEVENARTDALQQIEQQAAQLAAQISAKAIGRPVSEDEHRQLVAEALAEMGAEGSRI